MKKSLNKKSNPAWPLTSQGVFQKFIWALLPFITLSLEVFLCTFYMILESWSKRKRGFGWCQAFHIFGTYFTQSLDDGKMLFCFCILNKNSMVFEETFLFLFWTLKFLWCAHSQFTAIKINLKYPYIHKIRLGFFSWMSIFMQKIMINLSF